MEEVSLEMLYKQPLLDVLTDEELREVLPLFHPQEYGKGDEVFLQGDEARNFYLIHAGQFEVVCEEGDGEKRINLLYPGEFFGDVALLYDEPRGATVRAVDDSAVLYLTKEEFLTLLEEYPPLARRLERQGREIESRTQRTFPGLSEDEIIIYFHRRHWMALLRGVITRAGIAALIWLIVMFIVYLFTRDNADAQWGAILWGSIGLLIPLALAIWELLDWYNDYYVVTNQRVIHIEKVVLLSEERYEAPLNKIQNVRVVHHNPIAEAMRYGDLIVATAGQGGPTGTLQLSYTPEADVVAERIMVELSKERSILEQQGKEQKRQMLRAALGLESSTEVTPPEESGEEAQGIEGDGESPPSIIVDLLGSLFRYLRPTLREQKGSTIIWRKHWVMLLGQSIFPWLIFLVVVAVLLAELLFLDIAWLGTQLLFGGSLVILAGVAVWLWWEYEGWRNDLYILTPETIVDQEQKPLGFNKEVRRASLEMIQDTRYVQPNPLMVWLNVGNVLITTAGQEGLFTFNWVKNPRAVQYDIFQYIKALQQQRERNEAAAISQELLDLLRMYEEEKEKATNGSTPTPPPEPPAPSNGVDDRTRRWRER